MIGSEKQFISQHKQTGDANTSTNPLIGLFICWILPQLLESHGLHKYIDARCLQSELTEATGMTSEELDAAACCLLAEQQELQQQIDSQGSEEEGDCSRQRRLQSNSSDEATTSATGGETPTWTTTMR